MEIVNIKIGKLNPAEYNPRLDLQPADKEYQDIKRSVVEFGLVEPLVINKDMTVIGGHQRLKVLRDLNFSTVPCIIVDLDKQKEKMLNIALNKISGDWDRAKLKDILEELDTGEFDVSLTGFGEQEIEDLMTEFHVDPKEDDFDVDKAVGEVGEPICKRGDIWQLGEHRLMCGDATVEEDVKRLMDGKKADMVFTDPPYGIDYSGGRTQVVRKKNYGKIKGDKNPDITEFIEAIIRNSYKRDCYICVSPINLKPVFQVIDKYDGMIVWKKQSPGLGYQFIRRYCEFIIFFTKRKKNKLEKSEFDYWEMNTDLRTEYQHGTQKPIALSNRAIKYSSVKEDIIADWFGGSGSTLIACEQLNRKCYMMEIDPIYCDVIIKRWETYTNKKAVKINI